MPDDLITHARGIFALGAALYAAAFLFGLAALLTRHRYPRPLMLGILGAGLLAQTIGLHLRGSAIHACPLGNLFEIAQFIAWSLVLLFFIVGPAFRISLLGFFTAGAAAVIGGLPLFFPGLDAAYPPGLFGGNPWIEFHVSLAIFSYGMFALVALVSAMFLIQERGLKRKRTAGLYGFLPSVQQLDLMGRRLLVAGLASLSVALGAGLLIAVREPGLVPAYKLAAAGLVWAGYFTVAVLRQRRKLVTHRHAIAAITLFLAALVTLWPVQSARSGPDHGSGAPVETLPHE